MTRRNLWLIAVVAVAHAACSASESTGDRMESPSAALERATTTESNSKQTATTLSPEDANPAEPDPSDRGYRTLTDEEKQAMLWYWGWDRQYKTCNTRYSLKAVPPTGAENGKRYPLFLYFTGTRSSNEPSGYDNEAATRILETMSGGDNPYYAISVDYDNLGMDNVVANIGCIYGRVKRGGLSNGPTDIVNAERNALEVACRIPGVDCSTITVWGFSQGANMAIWAYDYNDSTPGEEKRVKAAWLTGYSTLPSQCYLEQRAEACVRGASCISGTDAGADAYCSQWTDWPKIPTKALRVVNGADDGDRNGYGNNNYRRLNSLTERACLGTNNCLAPKEQGGYGWYLVQASDLESNQAGHCWFDRPFANCTGGVHLDKAWTGEDWPNGLLPFSLAETAEWLKMRRAD